MRHKIAVLIVLVAAAFPVAADDLLCNFAVGGPSKLTRESDPRNFRVVTGTPESEKFERALQRVRQVTDIPSPVSFTIIDMPQENAFMFPNGKGYFTISMVARHNEDQLAAVIGHELDHYLERHGKRQLQRHLKWNALGGIALATAGGALESRLLVGTLLASVFHKAHKSRGYEDDADQFGTLVAVAGGYDPYQYAGLMDDFQARFGSPSGVLGRNLASHPASRNRAQRIRELADSAPRASQATQGATQPRAVLTPQRGTITLFVERINLSGYGYTSAEQVHQLMLTELRNYVRVFERQTPEVRYKAVLSANVVLGWSGSNRAASLPDLGIQVSAGRSRAHADFTGTVVDLTNSEVVGGATTPRNGTSKTNAGFTVQAGRLSPIAIQSQSFGNMEQILLQNLVREGIKAWVGALVSTIEAPEQPASQPAGLATYGVEKEEPDCHCFLEDGQSVRPGEVLKVFEGGEQVGAIKVISIEGNKLLCRLLAGKGPGPGRQSYR